MEYSQAHIYWTDDAGYKAAMDMKKILVSLDCKISNINVQTLPYSYCATYHNRVKTVVERYIKNNQGDLGVQIKENT